MSSRKLLKQAICRPANLRFADLVRLVEASIGFRLDRISWSHHIFLHPSLPVAVNIQNVRGKAKPYQVRQVLKLIERYNLSLEGAE